MNQKLLVLQQRWVSMYKPSNFPNPNLGRGASDKQLDDYWGEAYEDEDTEPDYEQMISDHEYSKEIEFTEVQP